jgi:hypothetical protein
VFLKFETPCLYRTHINNIKEAVDLHTMTSSMCASWTTVPRVAQNNDDNKDDNNTAEERMDAILTEFRRIAADGPLDQAPEDGSPAAPSVWQQPMGLLSWAAFSGIHESEQMHRDLQDLYDREDEAMVEVNLPKGGEWMPLSSGREGDIVFGDDEVPDTVITNLWDELEMANEIEKYEAWEALEDLLASQGFVKGPYMVPDERTLANKEWASLWTGTQPAFGDCWPFTTRFLGTEAIPHRLLVNMSTDLQKDVYRVPANRPEQHNLRNPVMNVIDNDNRLVVHAEMTQFGLKYHTANCEFGRIHVHMKFNTYLKNIGEPMKLLVRHKEADRKHRFSCIKVL